MLRKLVLAAMTLLCLATLPGCSSVGDLFGAKSIELSFPAVVDFSAVRCPEVDAATRNEWKRTTERPAHWGQPGPDGKKQPAKRGELQDHIDKLEIAEVRKNGTGQRVTAELDACRNGTKPTS